MISFPTLLLADMLIWLWVLFVVFFFYFGFFSPQVYGLQLSISLEAENQVNSRLLIKPEDNVVE